MKRRKKTTMREIRRNALCLLAYDEDGTWERRRHSIHQLIHWCMDKEFKAGDHEGSQNPYC